MPDTTCNNCGKTIQVMIFRGSGYCSIDCKKALGLDHAPYGNMMVVTASEQQFVEKRRRSLAAKNGRP